MSRILITGITGQDGSYLAEQLLAEGHEVHGTALRSDEAVPGATLHSIDLSTPGIAELIRAVEPHEVYNLAAISSVFGSWQQPAVTAAINGVAVAEMLAALRELADSGHPVRFVQASSAEIFGIPAEVPQNERTAIRPTSPYGASKAYAHSLVNVYRTAGVWASACILYNHESPRRPEQFVTRKITASAARIALGLQDRLELGNLAARRDWGWAPDYADALRRAARAETPDDYVIATGVAHSVEEFVAAAFSRVGIDDWRSVVSVSDEFLRSGDAPQQLGDSSHAREVLGWRPTVDFEGIVAAMVDADLEALR
ncbi:GDPmannose 4,6-dehydratase [Microbacteriaceae bacterium SG_E_30_P1]|uniref:GDP-mannose 4,6-dehydratase n=1 Tax=Antiquaquibacter oligotrophicus TaxID=2880260 RepID=A0ABT6KNX6_9MICO|nr:GDP-mannose 4,6-dehydratase [Antiquaquibacter oligotrophicus]MDH6181698.1 GDPmannose 4,6-dehydratase [Antiquaquibacter oligotrophicus]UDF12618.1 GDP-mannose 4,6-dehydratase [Antiquaquibacter oligotrophicus]